MNRSRLTRQPSRHRGWITRALLALLLVTAPLLAPLAENGSGTPPSVNPGHEQMPCHAGGPAAGGQHEAACPDCGDDMTMSQCECCDQAAPAGIATHQAGTAAPHNDRDAHPRPHPGPSPSNPFEAPYRPPIRIS